MMMGDLLRLSRAKFQESTRTVSSAGVVLLRKPDGFMTIEGRVMIRRMGVSDKQSANDMLSEFTARLTYLSFPDKPYDPAKYKEKLLSLGHSSPWNLKTVVVLFVGVSMETILEMVSGYANRSGRLTSSDTKSMDDPYYYTGRNHVLRDLVKDFQQWRSQQDINEKDLTRNERNQFQLASKVGAIVMSMEPDEWEELISARLSPNTHSEKEYSDILRTVYEDIPVSVEYAIRQHDLSMNRFVEYAHANGMFYKDVEDSYWYPSLNAGLPKVVKPDCIHQGTYRLHDLFHMILPDPLPHASRNNYIIGKFLGEVFSNILADGWAIQVLDKECRIKYNYSLRKVYPLWSYYSSKGMHPLDIVRTMATSISEYFLQGKPVETQYNEYIEHYSYFLEMDLVWNARNYDKYLFSEKDRLRQVASTNIDLWKNEHEMVSSQENISTDDMIDIYMEHIEAIASGVVSPKGDGIKLGDLLSDPLTKRVFPHEKMSYGKLDKQEYEDCLASLRVHF